MQLSQLHALLTRCLLMAVLLAGAGAFAAEPLHRQVDQLIAAKSKAAKQPLAAPADDAEFLRRAWFDFNGGIPSAEETRKFLADKTADKRAKLIDQLVAAPRFAEQMAEAFNIQLMERNGSNDEWRSYLTESFRANTARSA